MHSKALKPEETFFGGLSQTISEYGWYPTLALGFAALVSKEVYLIDVEFLVLLNFAGLSFVAYVMAADKFVQMKNKEQLEVIREREVVYQLEIDLNRARIEMSQAKLNLPQVVKDTYIAFKEAHEAAAKARDMKAMVAFREATLLARIGAQAEPGGPVSILLRGFPTFLFDRNVDPVEFLSGLFEKAESDAFMTDVASGSEEALRDVLDMMSCKAAIKAGDGMSDVELAALVRLRDDVERSSNCPHGRPTSVRLTIRELEKLFHRA